MHLDPAVGAWVGGVEIVACLISVFDFVFYFLFSNSSLFFRNLA